MYAKLAYGLAAVIALSAVALGSINDVDALESRSNFFWESVTYLGTQVENYDTLPDLVQNADAVVVGRITSAAPGRVFGDPPDDAAFYVAATLEVDEVLFARSGELPGAFTVEFVTHEASMVDSLVSSYPAERAIYFLRHNVTTAKMAGYSSEVQQSEILFWHVATPEAAIRDFGGTVRNAVAESEYLRALDGKPFADAVAAVRAAAVATADVRVP